MSDGPAEQDPSSEAVRQRLAARIAGLEERSARFGANLARFDARMDAWFDQIDARFDRMEERLDASIARLDSPFGMVNRSIDRVFRLLIVASVIMAVVLAKGFHWI